MPFSNKPLIQKHFDAKASQYESSAVLQQEVCQRMLERLDFVNLQPSKILDVGTGTGWGMQGLMQRYKSAQVFALDLSEPMLKQSRQKGGWLRKPKLICADAERLPIADESVDLIFSNLMLQWCNAEKVFAEFKRILKPNGLLMFSSFGPDTLKELRYSWAQLDHQPHVNDFIDMHDLGDALLTCGLAEPVMDADLMTLNYDSPRMVMNDLKNIGANTTLNKKNKGLLTPRQLKKVLESYESFRQNNVIPASYEVVYGHAWKTPPKPKKSDRVDFSFPAKQLLKP